MTQIDVRAIAKVHFDEMAVYLENHLARGTHYPKP
jgi:hypothetical protein